MSELRDLYQEVILDHYRRPRNFREIEDATRKVDGFNPLCGDRITVFVRMHGDVIQDVAFKGVGCAISTASASLMTEALKGKTLAEAAALFERFHELVTGPVGAEVETAGLGKLAVFSGVREFPARVKCASLAWHAVRAALENGNGSVSTE
jgi:nitrogen fixation NifU-like protein